jgi:predicted restriction endonuclease
MNNFQKIQIDGVEYYIVDSIQNLRAEDSFIQPSNKLKFGTGSGEARKYVGSYTGKNGDRLKGFFEYQNWGDTKGEDGKRVYPTISKNCFFSQSNFLKYLYDARIEYQAQEQIYHRDISSFFNKNLNIVQELSENIISFSIYPIFPKHLTRNQQKTSKTPTI